MPLLNVAGKGFSTAPHDPAMTPISGCVSRMLSNEYIQRDEKAVSSIHSEAASKWSLENWTLGYMLNFVPPTVVDCRWIFLSLMN